MKFSLSTLPVTLASFLLPLAGIAQISHGEEDGTPPEVVRIEEDWAIEIGTPSPEENAPQIVMVLSPVGGLKQSHCVFELNHSTLPEFATGGLQLQVWFGDLNVDHRNFPHSGQLGTQSETISFTTSMQIKDAFLQFEILDGSSTTWGAFGGQGYLKAQTPTVLTNLSEYDPSVSVKNSRVSFASHRVVRLVLKEVRYHAADGTVERVELNSNVKSHGDITGSDG